MKVVYSILLVLFAWVAMAGRTVTSLSGPGWTCDGESVSVPHTWNAADGADGVTQGLASNLVSGAAWDAYGMSITPDTYVRKRAHYTRALPDPTPGRRQFVRFDGASRRATVRINGQVAGSHLGAYTAFCVEATDFLKPTGNVLEVDVDNFWDIDCAPLSADYTLQGGIYREVDWIETPSVCIDPVADGARGVAVYPETNGTVKVFVRVNAAREVASSTELQTYHIPNPELWTPENPKLYPLHIEIPSGDAIDLRIGFRTVEFRADGFYLNGVKRRLRGVNRHQDAGLCGWAASREEETRDFTMIKELGADAVRLAHYPQSSHIYDLCDELGLLVWSETPAINWLNDTPAFRTNLLTQTREMVRQHGHHPCVFAWSIFNEIYNGVPPDREAEGWMEEILGEVKALIKHDDPRRPVVAASDRPTKRLLNDLPEQLAFNAYPGWYGETTMRQDLDTWFAASGRAQLGISEYGAGGNPFEHLDPLPAERLDPGGPLHPEETQVKLHIANWREICAEPRLWGTFIWAMYDFAADARREGGKNGINDKGLVTRDRAVKKDVFYFYQANWTDAPMLHVCSQRATETSNATATIVGFTTCDIVTLKVNGQAVSSQMPDGVHVVRWENVPLAEGENVIELSADELTSVRRIVRTSVR